MGGYVAALLAIVRGGPGGAGCRAGGSTRLTRALSRRLFGPEGLLAGAQPDRRRSRASSVVVGALATAIAMMASVGIMVGSFRETVVVWLDTSFAPTSTCGPRRAPARGYIRRSRPRCRRSWRPTPGVEAIDVFHGHGIPLSAASAPRWARAISTSCAGTAGCDFWPGQDRDAILRSLPGAGPLHRQRAVRQQARRARGRSARCCRSATAPSR